LIFFVDISGLENQQKEEIDDPGQKSDAKFGCAKIASFLGEGLADFLGGRWTLI